MHSVFRRICCTRRRKPTRRKRSRSKRSRWIFQSHKQMSHVTYEWVGEIWRSVMAVPWRIHPHMCHEGPRYPDPGGQNETFQHHQFIYVSRDSCTCDVTHSSLRHDTFIHVPCRIHVCNMTHSCMCRDWLRCIHLHIFAHVAMLQVNMGWLRLVGSLRVQVSFAKEPYKKDNFLQMRPSSFQSYHPIPIPINLQVDTQGRAASGGALASWAPTGSDQSTDRCPGGMSGVCGHEADLLASCVRTWSRLALLHVQRHKT